MKLNLNNSNYTHYGTVVNDIIRISTLTVIFHLQSMEALDQWAEISQLQNTLRSINVHSII